MKFYCELNADIPLPPKYSFPQAFNYLNSQNNSIYILEDEDRGYVQCAGDKLGCCIEYKDILNNRHYRLSKGVSNDLQARIQMTNGHVTVRGDEVLKLDDALAVFKSFHSSGTVPSEYRLNLLDQNYYSKSAQQVDSAEPSTTAVPPSNPPGSAR